MNLKKFALAIHGGAGTILPSSMTPEKKESYEQGLKQALQVGYDVLAAGGNAVVAVREAVRSLEDCPLFNAGNGSVFNHLGKHEMDASIMCGKTLEAGAVAGIAGFANPILIADEVMRHSGHILLIAEGATEFALERGYEQVADEYFFDAFRYEQYLDAIKHDRVQLDHTAGDGKKFGTVGAVAIDMEGNVAAATSTGGLTNKKYGRVGDSPIIGAGTYAHNMTCAVSCTGVGELFMKESVAFQIHSLMRDAGKSLQEACDIVVMDRLVKINGEGGLIALDYEGNIVFSFNSDGMYRGMVTNQGDFSVMIYK